MNQMQYTLGIDIGSTTVKIAILDEENQLLFADYERHFANIQETLAHLLGEAHEKLGELTLLPRQPKFCADRSSYGSAAASRPS